MNDLLSTLRCPVCRAELCEQADAIVCTGCAATYPSLGGVPCLLPDAHEVVAMWRRRAAHDLGALGMAADVVLGELMHDELRDATRRRLRSLARARAENFEVLAEIVARAGLGKPGKPSAEAASEGLPLFGLLELVLRDWGWGDEGEQENRIARDAVLALLGERALGRMLVLGAGAARLAYDLHVARSPTLTLALDINPLPLLVAQRLLHGETVPLYDVPNNPHHAGVAARRLELRAPHGPQPRFHLLLADGLAPPVPAHGIDTVLTPWFIDQAVHDLPALVATIHDRLAHDGVWINYGPLVYPAALPAARCYGPDEVLALLADGGFDVLATSRERVPYMHNPGASSGRSMHVLAFAAKRRDARPDRIEPSLPAWAHDRDAPVPIIAVHERYLARNPAIAALARALDGRASVNQLARTVFRGVAEQNAVRFTIAALRELLAAAQHED
ncbi:MAG TPA: hypothetical protein VG755_44320 [Nannocystaceae bacterium]|nr:hypothetical protein [Nannocystaceae bacterium]